MAILDAIRKAILRTDGSVVQEVFASSDQICVEMADLANEVAIDIVHSQDWRDLTKLHTITGDGTQTDFPLPADYDRMVASSYLQDDQMWFWGYRNIPTINEWLQWKQSGFWGNIPGGWTMLGGQMSFVPPPSGSATYPYISKLYAKDENGVSKAQFDRDTDTFFLGNDLITLGCIWKWMAQKKMDYGEDLQNYEISLSQAQTRDRGARVIRHGSSRNSYAARLAWPFPLGGP